MSRVKPDWQDMPNLGKITCTSTKCEDDLHCFKQKPKMVLANQSGICRSCGVELVDMNRVHKRELDDADSTFAALKKELWRHYFWHVEIDQRAVNHAVRKGSIKLRVAAEQRLRTSIGPEAPPRDGYQTPREGSGNSLHYAQHFTGSCCRSCVDYWHGIPKGQELSVDEIMYFTDLVMLYISARLPNLSERGVYVPPIRRK